ncbi:MAG: HEAT repeat domain-containing protein [Kiritimatiellae bacterium]|nr:HEAT repeat domain-containing protein [Kiritimatiellia bacterium]
MKNTHDSFAGKVRRRWCWGLVAVPLAGVALLLGAARGPEEERPAASHPKAVRHPAGRSVKTAPAPVVTAALVEEPAPPRAEKSGAAEHIEQAPLGQLLAERPELADALKTLLENQRPVAVMPREQMLALRGTPEDVIELIKLYHEAPSDEVRDEIFSAACTLSNPESAELLFQLLAASGESDLTTAAALSLARMADSVLLDEILYRYETAGTPDEQARLLGILYQIRSPSRVPALIGMAERQPGGDPATAVLQTLGMIGSPEAVEYLLDRLIAAGAPEERAAYGEALSWVVEADALPLLISAATDGSLVPAARAAAARALGNFMPEYVESLLGSMVSTERDAAVRRAAQEALEKVRS